MWWGGGGKNKMLQKCTNSNTLCVLGCSWDIVKSEYIRFHTLQQDFPTFLTPTPIARYWRFSDPQALIFTMKMMIIFKFGLLLVVFYDECHFIFLFFLFLTFASATPFLRPRNPRLGNPAFIQSYILELYKSICT